jgi:hypothetical protein
MTTILPRSICWTSPLTSSPSDSANSSRMRSRSPSRRSCTIRCFATITAFRPKSENWTGISIRSPTWKSGSSQRASTSAIWRDGSSTSSTTSFRATIRMSPSSRMSISASTGPPKWRVSAAMIPSRISSCNSSSVSERFAVMTRNASTIDVLSLM